MPRGRPKKIKEDINTNVPEISNTDYMIKGQSRLISAMSRQSISYRGNYYTFEYKEERELPTNTFVDLVKEKESLWMSVNSEVDKQINDMIDFLNEKTN